MWRPATGGRHRHTLLSVLASADPTYTSKYGTIQPLGTMGMLPHQPRDPLPADTSKIAVPINEKLIQGTAEGVTPELAYFRLETTPFPR